MAMRPLSRRNLLKTSAIAAAARVAGGRGVPRRGMASAVDRPIVVETPEGVRQQDVLFDPTAYSAFPHLVRLEGNELLVALRQAPRQERVRHTHPRSIITVMRSYDLGETWDVENAGQLAAGGGQEFAPLYLGNGMVGGLLAMHEVVPVREDRRTGLPRRHEAEYPYRSVGGFWCWSGNFGLTWPLHQQRLFAPKLQTCATAVRLRSGALLAPCYGHRDSDEPGVLSNVLYRSEDLGQTWIGPGDLARGTDRTRDYAEPCLLEIADGHLLAMHRVERCQDGRRGLLWRNESRDGGKTWTEPVETDISSGACPRLLKLTDGRVLLTYGRRYEPFGLYARLSEDGGKSWGATSWLLRAAPNGNQGYSSSVELEPGRVFTACYAQNRDGVTGITGTFWKVPPR